MHKLMCAMITVMMLFCISCKTKMQSQDVADLETSTNDKDKEYRVCGKVLGPATILLKNPFKTQNGVKIAVKNINSNVFAYSLDVDVNERLTQSTRSTVESTLCVVGRVSKDGDNNVIVKVSQIDDSN